MRGYATCSIVANPINRYSISPRQNLKTNSNGSTDLYIQNESPGTEKESNWRPAPKGKFVLMLRMYWPDEDPPSIIDGTWTPVAVKKTSVTSYGDCLRSYTLRPAFKLTCGS